VTIPPLEVESMEKSLELWSAPTRCRVCRYPVGVEQPYCPNCLSVGRPLSATALRIYWKRFGSLCSRLTEPLIHASLVGMAFYFCWSVCPFLLLFPIIFVICQCK